MHAEHRTILARGTIIVFFMYVLLMGGTACERLAPIQIENRTSEVLTVYIDEYRIGDVKPNGKIRNALVFAGHDWYTIKAFDTHGNTVYSHKFSHEEIRRADWKVVIPPLQSTIRLIS